MKWFFYLTAAVLTSLAAYPEYVRIDTGLEGIVGWITATITGGWFFGFVANIIYNRRKAKRGPRPYAAMPGNGKPPETAHPKQFFISI